MRWDPVTGCEDPGSAPCFHRRHYYCMGHDDDCGGEEHGIRPRGARSRASTDSGRREAAAAARRWVSRQKPRLREGEGDRQKTRYSAQIKGCTIF